MRRVLIACPLLALWAAACSGGSTATISDSGPVLGTIPWTSPEQATYSVSQGDTTGTGTFSILAGDNSLVFNQKFDIPANQVTDEVTVETDPTTLAPIKVDRTTVDVDPDINRTCEATYGDGNVTVLQKEKDQKHTDTVSVPTTHYDAWTDLFLWRTLNFSEGFRTRYTDVLSCNPRKSEVITVVLEVKGRESVTLPSGAYQAWHLKVDSGGSTQDAWYNVDPPHVLIKYDNGAQTFQLTSVQ